MLHSRLRAAARRDRIPTDGLVAWYDGAGLSGSTVTNNVAGGTDASVNGAPVVGSDATVTDYIQFDGTDDSLWATISGDRDSYTVSMKAYFIEPAPSLDNISNFFGTSRSSSSDYLQFWNYDHTNSGFDKTFHAKNTGSYSNAPWNPLQGQWITITLRISGTNVKIYVDGTLDTDTTLSEAPSLGFTRISFASNAYNLNNFCNCRLNDMLLYNYPRNDCESINLI